MDAELQRPFVFRGSSARVLFGSGSLARLPEEAQRLDLKRLMLIASERQADAARSLAPEISGHIAAGFTGAAMHTPVAVTEQAHALLHTHRIDGLLAIGGGSAIGLSKALAWRSGLPQIVCPTTYAGSEMTPILGETQNGQKQTRSDPRIQPGLVIYDSRLTLAMPPQISAASGMNAIAHAAEALYAADANPVISLMAEQAIAALATALPAVLRDGQDMAARARALYGAWLAGTCLGSVGMALHHKLCHVLGGSFGLPHAETHAAVLPHALAYNAAHAPAAMQRISRALGADNAAAAVFDLARNLGLGMALRDFGLPQQAIAEAAALAMAQAYPNPRPLEAGPLQQLLRQAWWGARPDTA